MSEHPITPSDELMQKWTEEHRAIVDGSMYVEDYIAAQTARYRQIADAELEACCALIGSAHVRDRVRASRRPNKPPSLAEQGLNAAKDMSDCMGDGMLPNRSSLEIICAALERLQQLELENHG